MQTRLSRIVFALSIAIGIPAVGVCQQPSLPLEKFTRCEFGNDFQTYKVDRLPQAVAHTVSTPSGDKDVHVLDGYRVLITYKQDESFLNMKVERLDAARFNADREVLLASLDKLAADPSDEPTVHKVAVNGFTFYGVNRKKLEGGVLGVYNLFDEKNNVVVTMYFLNDEPAYRKFQDLPGYERVRDEFLKVYAGCLTAAAPKK